MASRAQSVTITYTAWDTSANTGKTGDVANHTLRWVKDGTSGAPSNSPSEVDATNAPGIYKLTLTTAECTCDAGTLSGKSSTSDIVIIPKEISFEQLPTAAPDGAGGLPISDAGGLDLDALNTAAVRLTATRAQVLDDWINAGRLDAILDIIAVDVAGIDGDAMRGTDSAALASVCTEARLVALAAANLPTDIDTLVTRVTAAVATAAAVAALNDLSAAEVNAQVVDALATDTYAEPASIPAATVSLEDKIGFLYALARNKLTQTSALQTLRNDADGADIGTAAVSDDDTTFTRGEWT